MIDVHTIGVLPGTVLSDSGKVKIGFMRGIQVEGPSGALAGANLVSGGEDFTSIPALTAAGGTGGTLAAIMAIDVSMIGTAGTGYVVGDEITLTGGTSSEANVVMVDEVGANGVVAEYHSITDGGLFSVLPTGPLTQSATTGVGVGFTLDAVGYRIAQITATGGTKYRDGAPLTITGGGGRLAEAYVNTGAAGGVSEVSVRMPELSPSAVIIVVPNALSNYSVARDPLGITVTLDAIAGGPQATAFDLVIFD